MKGDTMQRYDIISKPYWSNCFIEAIRAKSKNSNVKIYFCKPRITENGNFQMLHFMWSDGVADYDFSDLDNTEHSFYKDLFFKGVIRRYHIGFAKKYSQYRNNKKR